jgi:hypothetical protein
MKWIAFLIAGSLTFAAMSSTSRAAPVGPLSMGGSADIESTTRVYYYYRPYYYRPYYYYGPYYSGPNAYRPYNYYCHRYYSWEYLYCAW